VVSFRRRQGSNAAEVQDDMTQPIARVARRSLVRVKGQVVRMQQRPTSGLPSLVVTIEDNTGRATAVWSGRRAIGGIGLGRTLVIEGVPVAGTDGPTFFNPAYTLLP
jgi:DNA/RNA endonuclease YhcR with UshA esterase domain